MATRHWRRRSIAAQANEAHAESVEKSIEQRVEKRVEKCVEKCVESLRSANPDLDVVLARLLCLRGVTPAGVEDYLQPRMARLLPDPSGLADMDKAVERLLQALRSKQKVGIITDYDVDGACCASLFISYWRALGGTCSYTIPDRFSEGYGPNLAAFARLRADGVEGLVLTTDCGTNAEDIFTQARAQADWDIIVLDHHEIAQTEAKNSSEDSSEETAKQGATGSASPIFATINPYRADNEVDVRSFAACGVVFMLLIALRRRLVADGIVANPPPLKPWLDILALATICDVVALSPLNRAFVRLGLRILASGRHAGLAALAQLGEQGFSTSKVADGRVVDGRVVDGRVVDGRVADGRVADGRVADGRVADGRVADGGADARIFSARDLGFFFGPRLNACGRMGESLLAVELLLCVEQESATRARRLAVAIEKLNARRREQQDACCQEALALATQQRAEGASRDVCFLTSPATSSSWSVGVLGPSASRLAERLGCPIFLANEDSLQDLLRGSARMPQQGYEGEEVNLARIVASAKDAGLLSSAGGHARACGFTLSRATVDSFRDFLNDAFAAKMTLGCSSDESSARDPSTSSCAYFDMELLPSAVGSALAENLLRLAPFGRGNEEPLFAFRDVFIDDCRFVGKARRHLVCSLSAQGGVSRARAIAFEADARGLAQKLLRAAETRRPEWLVGKLRLDGYSQGGQQGGQIVIEDFACAIDGMY